MTEPQEDLDWDSMDPVERLELKVDYLTSLIEGFMTGVQEAMGPIMEQVGPMLGMLGITPPAPAVEG